METAMDRQGVYCIAVFIIAVAGLHAPAVASSTITANQLADLCESMETAITDVSMQFEFSDDPPRTEADIPGPGVSIYPGPRQYRYATAIPFSERFVLEESAAVIGLGYHYDHVQKSSYNGRIGKHLTIGGSQGNTPSGLISPRKPPVDAMLSLSPLAFSVMRFSMSNITQNKPLSSFLRQEEWVNIDTTVRDVDGFRTIRVDLLTGSRPGAEDTAVWARVYFSVDHAYTPVRYEHMTGGKAESNKVSLAFEVTSLREIAGGLWLPTSGCIRDPDQPRVSRFKVDGEIAINQGLTDKDFDIEFPGGTVVQDELLGLSYVVKPSQQELDAWLENESAIAKITSRDRTVPAKDAMPVPTDVKTQTDTPRSTAPRERTPAARLGANHVKLALIASVALLGLVTVLFARKALLRKRA
jgi:hypothetical protein